MKRYVVILISLSFGLILGGVGGYKVSHMILSGQSLGYVNYGMEYLNGKDYIRAMAYFNKATALDPESFLAHLTLADIYHSMNSYDLALEEYDTSLRLAKYDREKKLIKEKMDVAKQKQENEQPEQR